MKQLLSSEELERYSSQINMFEIGIQGQEKLKSSCVSVVGSGGLGCGALQYLAAAGIGRIRIIDDDCITLSNLQRQILYREQDIGHLKCEIAKNKLLSINPHVVIDSIPKLLSSQNATSLLAKCDVVIDATDNYAARYIINDACKFLSIPFIYGAIHHFEGHVASFNAKKPNGTFSPNYRDLFPEPPNQGSLPPCTIGGVIGALAGIIGSMQALEAIKQLIGHPDTLNGKLLVLNALNWSIKQYHIETPVTGLPIEISLQELQTMAQHKVRLIHVNDLDQQRIAEYNMLCKVERHIFIIYCPYGIKSKHAAKLLRDTLNYEYIYSLAPHKSANS